MEEYQSLLRCVSMLPAVCWVTDRQLNILEASYGPRVTYFEQSRLSALHLANPGVQPTPKIDHYPDVVAHRRVLAGEVAVWRMGRGEALLACAHPLRADDGSVKGVMGFAIDLSELQEQSEQREMHESLLEAFAEMVPAQVTVLDENQSPLISFAQTQAVGGQSAHLPGQRVSSQTVSIGPGKSVTLNVKWLPDVEVAPQDQPRSNEAEQHIRLLLESSPHAQAVIDAEGAIRTVNQQWREVFGSTNPPDGVEHVMDLISPPYRDRFSGLLAATTAPTALRETVRLLMQRADSGAPLLADVLLTCSASSEPRLQLLTVIRIADPATRLEQGEITVTATDARILEMLAQGLGNAEIAQAANLSRQGLDYRIKLLKRTLKVNGRGALVARAFNYGLFDGSSWPPRVNQSIISND
ncbi:PAS domain S-box protein [Streptomyces sp. NPDC048362]|uniref:PAS domain S-box protein n=1 Tax=Streptomyces sp. NPDC048362 TaxID=3365539 RepID=UPI00372377DF